MRGEEVKGFGKRLLGEKKEVEVRMSCGVEK